MLAWLGIAVGLAVGLARAESSPTAGAREYELQGSRSLLFVKVYKDPTTYASTFSHDHVVQAKNWKGSVTWNPANVAACKVSVSVPVTGLEPDDPALRSLVGFSSLLDAAAVAEVRANILHPDQLDAKRFPEITFTSTACLPADGARVAVNGNLAIHGVQRPVMMSVMVSVDDKSFRAVGGFSSAQSEFGIRPYSALFGQLQNADRMDFVIDAWGKAK
jgi:polyisoprenoid-binding protein YceI